MKKINNKLQEHLKNNPQINENNYCNIHPYFGRYDENGKVVDKVYIGYDYIVNIYDNKLTFENEETGKITKRKL